ncbi:hypothetical protein JM18_006472 [Phytophthora kernoviae]|uniref:Capsule synthesis protein CapA domain-containing protein n=2 Tax=Phytophthora kernoviae TaxID=325452 RepID=A0A921SFG3_9STRA|nr:hypothetical protein G195_007954 [Phytophthora kernoviae 00238/432]KAG2521578.1 hypothetical protein JM18_006472 [Phytophthora kernoviae]
MYPKNLPLVFNRFASAIFGDAGEEGAKNSRNKPTFSIPYVISMANNRIMNFGHIAFDQETLPARDTLPGDAYVVSIGRSILDAAQTARIPLYSHESNYVNCIAVEAQAFRREYSHCAMDEPGVDLICGHSSHHIRGMELYRHKLIIYEAGDLVNDYKGFANRGDEAYCTLGALFLFHLNVLNGILIQFLPTLMNRLQL